MTRATMLVEPQACAQSAFDMHSSGLYGPYPVQGTQNPTWQMNWVGAGGDGGGGDGGGGGGAGPPQTCVHSAFGSPLPLITHWPLWQV